MTVQITEKDGLQKQWYEDAKKQTLETLADFSNGLVNNYIHDYGTICHAVAASALAGAYAIDRSKQGGITGFQASVIVLEFIKQWNGWGDSPFGITKFENLLYPQYENKFTTISESTWKWLQEKAKWEIENVSSPIHKDVLEHWYSIVNGEVPFDLKVVDKDGKETTPMEIPFENTSGDLEYKSLDDKYKELVEIENMFLNLGKIKNIIQDALSDIRSNELLYYKDHAKTLYNKHIKSCEKMTKGTDKMFYQTLQLRKQIEKSISDELAEIKLGEVAVNGRLATITDTNVTYRSDEELVLTQEEKNMIVQRRLSSKFKESGGYPTGFMNLDYQTQEIEDDAVLQNTTPKSVPSVSSLKSKLRKAFSVPGSEPDNLVIERAFDQQLPEGWDK